MKIKLWGNKGNFVKLIVKSAACLVLVLTASCKKEEDDPIVVTDPKDTITVTPPTPVPFDINNIKDTYEDVAPFANYQKWGPYNVHDPSIFKDGDYYYCYSTDAGFGIDVRLGLQIRKSKDLVNWEFVGWVFNVLPPKGKAFIEQYGGIPNNSLWAPYVLKVGSEYRLYYSLASNKGRLSVIGLATATAPGGPWKESAIVVSSRDDSSVGTNAIDPTVIVDQTGQHFMYYGSSWDGIYILKLDPTTGLAAAAGSKGKRIAQRGSTGSSINGNIEGPDIIYNKELKKYFLFISYDWLETKYNVRVGRADAPEGPFLDYFGNDINTRIDQKPMIIAPYKFQLHGGWQGTSHMSVFENSGKYYIAHQGRPAVNKYFMDLHVRKLYWSKDGWPMASPERYAAIETPSVPQTEVAGNWEYIVLNYKVVPGYSAEQVSPDFQVAINLKLGEDGSINDDAGSKWKYEAPYLELTWSNGTIDKVIVDRERDWENKVQSTLIFTGLNQEAIAVWGKKKK